MCNTDIVATCCFVNVGQGTSQVILLGDFRAIVIDTGRYRPKEKDKGEVKDVSPLILLLKEHNIQHIEALILSHNDADHVGDVKNVLDCFCGCIDKIYLLIDRKLEDIAVYADIKEAISDNSDLERLVERLEVHDTGDIWKNNEKNICVSVLHPYFIRNLELTSNSTNVASSTTVSNATCGVIALTVKTQKVIFSGDAPVKAWRRVVNNNGVQRVQILTVPHHGGNFWSNKGDREWFFDNIKTDYAIVSVGYGNRYDHPEPEVIRSFVSIDAEVFCTQSNKECVKGLSSVIGVCCDMVIADIGVDRVSIYNLDELRKSKERFTNRLCKSS
ncbi:MAG: hypothetical protein LBP59_10395 [Planctomycetaceae bacterium]|jgi:competence protein ComEC|nr:hypothetical protein [Planctomycetaceae bacterium]